MTAPLALMALATAWPLLLALLAVFAARPARSLPWGALPALACALWVPVGTELDLPQALLGAALRLDATGALFLGFSALVWACAGLYAQGYLAGKPHERSFCIFWHLVQCGSLGVCLAADVVGFYVFFALLSLAAYPLVIHERSEAALAAGRVYIVLALVGETALLLALLLGTDAAGSIRIDEVREAIAGSRWADAAVLGLVVGFGVKAGLVPLHGWLPLAHAAAPVPASAVLSGVLVKAGLLGLIRLLPADGALAEWGSALSWAGLLTAYAGVLLGLPQRAPKPVLAYSTMSQMGLLMVMLGLALGGAEAVPALGLQALHHGLAKGALFLAAGVIALTGGPLRSLVLILAALLGASMAGMPLTGGALAKLSGKEALGSGLLATLTGAAAIGTGLLVLRFLWLAAAAPAPAPARPLPRSLAAALAVLACAALLLPFVVAEPLAGLTLAGAFEPKSLWGAAWPVAAALLLGAIAWRAAPRAPDVPVGDVAAWLDARWVRFARRRQDGARFGSVGSGINPVDRHSP